MPAGKMSIPLHRLREHTDKVYHIARVDRSHYAGKEPGILDAHRDDHYIFMLSESGRGKMMVDFRHYTIETCDLFYVQPGQVHQYIETGEGPCGWFLALDAGVIPGMFRVILEDPLYIRAPVRPDAVQLSELTRCLELILAVDQRLDASVYYRQTVYALLNSFAGMVTAIYSCQQGKNKDKVPRSQLITQQFRKLLSRDYKTQKSPAEYAVACNLSLSYLNEAVKSVSGYSVSHWIHQEVVLEARRLLYHSDSNIKEIAYELGYEDHTYFSRLFKKVTGETPGDFRKRFRE